MVDLAPVIASIQWLLLFRRWLGNDCRVRWRAASWDWCGDMIHSPGQRCNGEGNESVEMKLQRCPRFSSCQNDNFSPRIIYLHKTHWNKSWYPWTVISFWDLWPYTDERHAGNSTWYARCRGFFPLMRQIPFAHFEMLLNFKNEWTLYFSLLKNTFKKYIKIRNIRNWKSQNNFMLTKNIFKLGQHEWFKLDDWT